MKQQRKLLPCEMKVPGGVRYKPMTVDEIRKCYWGGAGRKCLRCENNRVLCTATLQPLGDMK